MLMAHRFHETFRYQDLSAYGMRVSNILKGRTQSQHDLGFFFLYVVRDGHVDLDKNLKTDTNAQILTEVREWLSKNNDNFDLPMIRE